MENYKEKQKMYKDMIKYNWRTVWVSKDPENPVIKGRTYIKPLEERLAKKAKKNKKRGA